ncbi:ABC transporter permease [Vibrio mediterranei]|uniref:ABC transporter permease n=1 Tax=Vibrio mediterranei TaxID=689 RepID=UPI001EFD4BF9|nr:FtsX-like permease family protein [Vibrio mediterranei]MCG9623784.1 ABC transporter permease [Vibrio mediterranei]
MLIKMAWRNLWRNKIRTGIMAGAMVFGLVGVVAMMGFMNGMTENMVHNAIAWQTSHLQIHNQRFDENPDIKDTIIGDKQIEAALEADPNINQWVSRFVVDGMMASARSTRGVTVLGIDSTNERDFTPIAERLVDGEWLDEKGRNPILVSAKNAQRLKLRVGSKVVITFTDPEGEVTGAAFRVRGIFKTPSSAYDDGHVLVRKSDIQSLAQLNGVHEYAVQVTAKANADSEEQVRHVVSDLQSLIPSGNVVQGWYQLQPLLATMINTMKISNQVMLTVFVVAMAFGIVNIMLMSVFERTQEFGVLMAVGMQKHKIFMLVMLETVLLGSLGAVLGIVFSKALIAILGHTGLSLGSMAQGLGAYGVDTLLFPTVSNEQYLMVFVTVFIASIVAALYPARQILKQKPVEAMSDKK